MCIFLINFLNMYEIQFFGFFFLYLEYNVVERNEGGERKDNKISYK